MRKKQPVSFAQKFPNADPLALRLLERLLAFDPKDRPNAEEVGYSYHACLLSSSFFLFILSKESGQMRLDDLKILDFCKPKGQNMS